jgi:hypothetical protein
MRKSCQGVSVKHKYLTNASLREPVCCKAYAKLDLRLVGLIVYLAHNGIFTASFLDTVCLDLYIASSLECKKPFLEPCVWSQTCRQVTEVFLYHFYLYTVTKPKV